MRPRSTARRAPAESEVIADHLRGRAERYFRLSPGAPAEVRLIGHSTRTVSRLYTFSVRVADEERTILVKACSVPSRRAEDSAAGSKPRRAAPAEPEQRFLLEHRALSSIERHFSSLNDPRFAAVRIFDVLPRQHAVIMECAEHPPLRRLLLRACLPGQSPAVLSATFRNTGAWLREFHSIPGDEQVRPRHTHRDDLIDFVNRLTHFLGERLDDEAFFLKIRKAVERLAKHALPAEPPAGLGHGDFAPRNVLVAPHHRILVLDTLARFRTPIYEDVGYFLVNLRCGWPQVLGRGGGFPAASIPVFARAFTEGYFGARIPVAAVGLYEVQAMLDKWASAVAAGGATSAPLAKIRNEGRRMMLSRLFRHEIPERLARAQAGLRTMEPSPAGRIGHPSLVPQRSGALPKNGRGAP